MIFYINLNRCYLFLFFILFITSWRSSSLQNYCMRKSCIMHFCSMLEGIISFLFGLCDYYEDRNTHKDFFVVEKCH
jgi:hypothetical protein